MVRSRRRFLKVAAASTVGPYFCSASQGLADETTNGEAAAESRLDRMKIGVIGCGGMGMGNIRAAKEWLDVLAVADVDEGRAAAFNQTFAGGKAQQLADYRAMLDDDRIELIHIATPDHWHTKPLVEAMLAGKDVYCEKPLTLTIDEGKLIRKVQRATNRIVQVGTQQRSTYHLFVKALAMVNEGRLGKIHRVQAAIGGAPSSPELPVAELPTGFDWDRWLGPAPVAEFRSLPAEERSRPFTNGHYEFRWWYEYSGGKLTDWGAHHVDICTWALALNGQDTGFTRIAGSAEHPVEFIDGVPAQLDRYNTATKFNFTVDFPEGAKMVIRNDTDNGCLIEGDKGRIFVNRQKLVGAPVEALVDDPLPEDAISKVYKGLPVEFNERKAHWANFLHCVRERTEPISDVHSHMRMLNICHAAGIAARLGRGLQWDAAKEDFVGDQQASDMLARHYRGGYEIELGQTAAVGG